jgi:hypothetical protein
MLQVTAKLSRSARLPFHASDNCPLSTLQTAMSSLVFRLLRQPPYTPSLHACLNYQKFALKCTTSLRPPSHSNPARTLRTSASRRNDDVPQADSNTAKALADKAAQVAAASKDPETEIYLGPLTKTFRRLKIFSVGSLGLTAVMAPLLFIVETASAVPLAGRVALAGTVLVTSSVSTMLVGWLGMPYVNVLRWLPTRDRKQPAVVEITTTTLTLKDRITRVYDTAFLVPTNRPLAKWELAEGFKLPTSELDAALKEGSLPREETIAETMDKGGNVLGRWIVKWNTDGTGTCRQVGKVIRWASSSVLHSLQVHQCIIHADISMSTRSSWERIFAIVTFTIRPTTMYNINLCTRLGSYNFTWA